MQTQHFILVVFGYVGSNFYAAGVHYSNTQKFTQ